MDNMELAMWKYVAAWIPMVCIALANGALRDGWYGKHLGALQAHQLSTVSGVVLFGVYIWVVVRLWRPASGGQAVIIGLVWLALMAAFELLLGHDVARGPWSRLRKDYDLFAGRLWLVVLVWITIAPYLFYRLQT